MVHMTVDAIRIAMMHVAETAFVSFEPILQTRYTLDDIIDQAIMESIIIDYQMSAPRKSLRQHCVDHGMPDDGSDDREYKQLARRMKKANLYKRMNAESLERSTGVRLLDLTENGMNGPSNYQNPYDFSNVDFLDLLVLERCKLLQKIFEHKVSNTNGTRNPQFKTLFSEYENVVSQMGLLTVADSPCVAIERTIELFNLHRAYNIELFYTLTLEAERHGFPKPVPAERIVHLCARADIIPPSRYSHVPVMAAEHRMFMVRDTYCNDVFALSDDEWKVQLFGLMEACRLKTILIRPRNGRGFFNYVHELSPDEKLEFIRDRYWLWSKEVTFDWSNRKRIQYMRDLYAVLTTDMANGSENSQKSVQ